MFLDHLTCLFLNSMDLWEIGFEHQENPIDQYAAEIGGEFFVTEPKALRLGQLKFCLLIGTRCV